MKPKPYARRGRYRLALSAYAVRERTEPMREERICVGRTPKSVTNHTFNYFMLLS